MTPSLETPDGAEARVRALLGDWAQRAARGLVPDFASRISIVSIDDKTAYAGFARCLFDERTASAGRMLPYREGAAPKFADRKDLWAVESGLSRQFLEQEAQVVAAESGQPIECNRCAGESQLESCERCKGAKTEPCAACSGRGRKSCAACKGRGAIPCAPCGGTGKVLQSLSNDGMRSEDVCPQCTGKKELPCADCADAAAPDCADCANKRVVACSGCAGRGTAPCASCEGARRVLPGFTLSIAYKLGYYRSLLRDPSVPEAVFPEDPASGKLGQTVVECDGTDAAALAARKPDGRAGDAFSRVLAQVPPAGANSKLLLQALSVEKIPIYEVAYAFEGKEYRAWATSFQNRLLPQGDPFADLAQRWSDEAESFLEKGDGVRFEERAAQAAALAPGKAAAAGLRAKAGAIQRRGVLGFGSRIAVGAAVAVPVLLAVLYRSPNRFVPLAALGLGILGCALGSVFRAGAALASRPLLPEARRNAWAGGAAAGGAALALVLFLLVGPVRRIDAREFDGVLARYEALPFVDWTAADDEGLTAAIDVYAARGVDTAAGADLRDRRAGFIAAARAQAQLEEQARRRAAEEARVKAAEAKKREAARAKALAAKKAAAKKAAAAKAAAAKAKKAKKKR